MARPKKSDGDKSILSALKEITKSDDVAYYIVFRYAPELLEKEIKTYEDLQATYTHFENRSEKNLEKLLFKESSQKAIKFILKRIDTSRDIKLLNKYYELAEGGDVQALKAYMEFKKSFFSDDNETDELKSLLRGATLTSKDETFEMNM